MRRLFAFLLLALAGCTGDAAPPAASGAEAPAHSANVLTLTLDGKPWKADRGLFGAVDPPGFPRTVLMSGSIGPKDANEQTFNLNVGGVDGPGRYVVRSGEASVGNAAQIANLSPQRPLVGNVFGFDLTVDIVSMQKSPVRIVAHFSGTLTANDGAQLVVADGEFRYSE